MLFVNSLVQSLFPFGCFIYDLYPHRPRAVEVFCLVVEDPMAELFNYTVPDLFPGYLALLVKADQNMAWSAPLFELPHACSLAFQFFRAVIEFNFDVSICASPLG